MPFVAKHVRLTNSGKIPELFLTSKVQAPNSLADAKLGKLYFVLQIDGPWSSMSPIGSSVINGISREYYRQEGHVPLENFERAIAKANRLIEQLVRDGESQLLEHFHALVALAVGDEVHLAYAGQAEAYFLRDGKLNLITEPGAQPPEQQQVFNNLITGEISASDMVLLGSPTLYGSLTTDELELTLKQPLTEAGLALARRLKSLKVRNVNAIIIEFSTLQSAENQTLNAAQETVYLDQRIDSAWNVASYNLLRVWRPVQQGLSWLGQQLSRAGKSGATKGGELWKNKVQPQTAAWATKAAEGLKQTKLPKPKLTVRLPSLPTLPAMNLKRESVDPDIPVHHYGQRKARRQFDRLIALPLKLLRDLGRQFRAAVKRSPRTWYIVIALLILSSIGASIQTRKKSLANTPIATQATIEEMKSLVNEAKQARVYGNPAKAREAYLAAVEKGELAKQNPKLATQAQSLASAAEKELYSLSGASELTAIKPILTLPVETRVGTIHEGTFYYTTQDGKLYQLLLTGGEPTLLGQLPNDQAVNQLTLDVAERLLYLQTYSGDLFSYDLTAEALVALESPEAEVPVATGLGTFGQVLYLLDPANSQIWKYTAEDGVLAKPVGYLKTQKIDLATSIGLAIDGSLFTLMKDGTVHKFSRGSSAEFSLSQVPAPYDKFSKPLGFFAHADADRFYLADQGNDKIPARFIEVDSKGKFSHQYLLPDKLQNEIRFVYANPKSHKAWVLAGKELYEFTLVQ